MSYLLGDPLSLHSRQPSVESTMSLSPYPDGKKMMQTTVAVIKDNPHEFEVQRLRNVPLSERQRFASPNPAVNFERPFAQARLKPTHSPFGPTRSTSSLSIASQCQSVRSAEVSSHSHRPSAVKGLGIADATSVLSIAASASQRSGLGISPSPSKGSNISLDTPAREYVNHILAGYHRTRDNYRRSLSPHPDLSYGGSTDDSGAVDALLTPHIDKPGSNLPHAGVGPLRFSPHHQKNFADMKEPQTSTPALPSNRSQHSLRGSPSSELARKARSMHTLNSLPSFKYDDKPLPEAASQFPSSIPSSSSSNGSLRQARARTVCEDLPGDRGRMHRRKRHAIYGDGGMGISFVPPQEDYSFAAVFAPKETQPLSSIPKKQLTSSRRVLNFLDHNVPSKQIETPAKPITIKNVVFPLSIIELLEELDEHIAEWQTVLDL